MTALPPPGSRSTEPTSATVPTLAYSPSCTGTRKTRSASPTSTVSVTDMLGKTTVSSSGISSKFDKSLSPWVQPLYLLQRLKCTLPFRALSVLSSGGRKASSMPRRALPVAGLLAAAALAAAVALVGRSTSDAVTRPGATTTTKRVVKPAASVPARLAERALRALPGPFAIPRRRSSAAGAARGGSRAPTPRPTGSSRPPIARRGAGRPPSSARHDTAAAAIGRRRLCLRRRHGELAARPRSSGSTRGPAQRASSHTCRRRAPTSRRRRSAARRTSSAATRARAGSTRSSPGARRAAHGRGAAAARRALRGGHRRRRRGS